MKEEDNEQLMNVNDDYDDAADDNRVRLDGPMDDDHHCSFSNTASKWDVPCGSNSHLAHTVFLMDLGKVQCTLLALQH